MFSAWSSTCSKNLALSTPIPAFAWIAGQFVAIGWAFWRTVPLLWP